MMSGVSAFLWQAALMLLAAYFLGAFIGCWLRRRLNRPPKVAMEANVGASTAAGGRPTAATAAGAAEAATTDTSSSNAAPEAEEQNAGAMGDAAARTAAAVPQPVAPPSAPATPIKIAPEEPPIDIETKKLTPPMSAAAAAAAALAARQAANAASDQAQAAVPAPVEAAGPSISTDEGAATTASTSVSASDLPTASGSSGQAIVSAHVSHSEAAVPSTTDDLTLIEGVTSSDAQTLGNAGISTFAAIAAWSAADVLRVNALVGDRRVSRENWIEQAQLLQSGTETVFSQRSRPALAPRPEVIAAAAPAAVNANASNSNVETVVAARKPEVPDRAAFSRPRRIYADDLQQIDGINTEVEKLLNEQGVTRVAQIAGWPIEEQQRIDRLLGGMNRVSREGWVGQAQRISGITPATPDPVAAEEILEPAADVPTQTADAATPPLIVSEEPAGAEPVSNVAPLGTASSSASAVRGLRSVRSEALVGPNTVISDGVNDDLKHIRGIGVLIEKRLRAMGYTSYAQIGSWTQSDVDRVNQQLDFRGRIERENWIEQARILAAGGQTDFSRRQERDEN